MKPSALVVSLLLVLSACAPTVRPATTASPAPAVDARIDSIFAHFGPATPGCAVGVYRAGEIVFAKGYGMANLEYGVPITPETVFEIASNTKQLTAFAIQLLARRAGSYSDQLARGAELVAAFQPRPVERRPAQCPALVRLLRPFPGRTPPAMGRARTP